MLVYSTQPLNVPLFKAHMMFLTFLDIIWLIVRHHFEQYKLQVVMFVSALFIQENPSIQMYKFYCTGPPGSPDLSCTLHVLQHI